MLGMMVSKLKLCCGPSEKGSSNNHSNGFTNAVGPVGSLFSTGDCPISVLTLNCDCDGFNERQVSPLSIGRQVIILRPITALRCWINAYWSPVHQVIEPHLEITAVFCCWTGCHLCRLSGGIFP